MGSLTPDRSRSGTWNEILGPGDRLREARKRRPMDCIESLHTVHLDQTSNGCSGVVVLESCKGALSLKKRTLFLLQRSRSGHVCADQLRRRRRPPRRREPRRRAASASPSPPSPGISCAGGSGVGGACSTFW